MCIFLHILKMTSPVDAPFSRLNFFASSPAAPVRPSSVLPVPFAVPAFNRSRRISLLDSPLRPHSSASSSELHRRAQTNFLRSSNQLKTNDSPISIDFSKKEGFLNVSEVLSELSENEQKDIIHEIKNNFPDFLDQTLLVDLIRNLKILTKENRIKLRKLIDNIKIRGAKNIHPKYGSSLEKLLYDLLNDLKSTCLYVNNHSSFNEVIKYVDLFPESAYFDIVGYMSSLIRAHQQINSICEQTSQLTHVHKLTQALCFDSVADNRERAEVMKLLHQIYLSNKNVTKITQCTLALHSENSNSTLLIPLIKWISDLSSDNFRFLQSLIPQPEIPFESMQLNPDIPLWFQISSKTAGKTNANIPHNWKLCIQNILSTFSMQNPWDSMPLSLLLPFKDELEKQRLYLKKNDICKYKLNYLDLLNTPQAYKFLSNRNDFSYLDFCSVGKPNYGQSLGVIDKSKLIHPISVEFLAYQTLHFEKKVLLPAIDKARKLKLPLLVIGNVTNGNTALTALNFEKFKKENIKTMFTKQASTDFGARNKKNPNLLNQNLLSQEQLKYIIKNKPLILVVDVGSQGDRHPAAFRAYRQVAGMINQARGIDPYPIWRAQGLDDTPLLPQKRHQPLRREIQRLVRETSSASSSAKSFFELHYTSQMNRPQPTQFFKEVPPQFSWDNVKGSGMVCVQMAMTLQEIEMNAHHGDYLAQDLLQKSQNYQYIYSPPIFDDDNNAQTPEVFLENQVVKIEEPLHRLARDAYERMKMDNERMKMRMAVDDLLQAGWL
jgi:hypothetical protein